VNNLFNQKTQKIKEHNKKRRINLLKKSVVSILVVATIGSVVLNNNSALGKVEASSKKDVIEFEYSSTALDDNSIHLRNKGVFKTEYFSKPSTEYNHDLAVLSLNMALASSTTAESYNNWGDDYVSVLDTFNCPDDVDLSTARNGYIVDTYKKLGFTNDVYEKYEVSLNDTSDTIAFSIATKEIRVDGKKENLVICNARSVSYGAEWASNFTMSNEENKTGFFAAGEIFYDAIKKYIEEYDLGKNTKFWFPGYSRGGAAANVAAALLNRDIAKGKYQFTNEDVYAYIYATPQVTTDSDYNSEIHNNIFNIVNEADIVPRTAPNMWGFKRFGKVLTIPQIYASKKELTRIDEGKKVKLDAESVELIKKISSEYNEIRYTNCVNSAYDIDPDKTYIGFAINTEFVQFFDNIFYTITGGLEEYKEKYQGVTKEIVPFLISCSRTYDVEQGKWVAYDSLADYLCEKYGTEIFNEASEAGVYSQAEYTEKMTSIQNMRKYKLISEDTVSLLEYCVNTYYGVRIIAYKYGIDIETIKEFTGSLLDTVWQNIRKFNVSDPFYCKYVHYAEFYLAWMRNYNPYTQMIIE